MINLALEAKPDDMVITMHICRGNFRSTWFTSGGYEPVASTEEGNLLTKEEQWNKVKLVKEIAEEVWQ